MDFAFCLFSFTYRFCEAGQHMTGISDVPWQSTWPIGYAERMEKAKTSLSVLPLTDYDLGLVFFFLHSVTIQCSGQPIVNSPCIRYLFDGEKQPRTINNIIYPPWDLVLVQVCLCLSWSAGVPGTCEMRDLSVCVCVHVWVLGGNNDSLALRSSFYLFDRRDDSYWIQSPFHPGRWKRSSREVL